jgi:hypothetical protein
MSIERQGALDIEALHKVYSDVYVVLSPPRCVSTAFSRSFWEQPSVGYYSHEPFETTYFLNDGLNVVFNKLMDPLDVRPLKKSTAQPTGNAIVVKEMPYQVGDNFPLLLEMATKPLTILIRDPRLSIYSRMTRRREAGRDPLYPLVETGWELLEKQMRIIEEQKIPHVIVETSDFRRYPKSILSQVFTELGLPIEDSMLDWKSAHGVNIDNLSGRHQNQYERALESVGIQPPTEEVPTLDMFPVEGGFRDHIPYAMAIYEELAKKQQRVLP